MVKWSVNAHRRYKNPYDAVIIKHLSFILCTVTVHVALNEKGLKYHCKHEVMSVLCVLLYVNYVKPEVDILIAYKIAIHLDFPVLT